MLKLGTSGLIGVILLLALGGHSAHAQEERTIPVVSDEDYEQVLNLLFPLNALKEPSYDFVTILRYKPSFVSESQVVLIGREGYVQVIEYRSLDGNLNTKLSEMLEGGELSPAEMAKWVRVSRRETRVSFSQAQKWRGGLIAGINSAVRPKSLRYVPPAKTVTVITDGTEYELWDSSGGGEIHFSLVGSETHKRIFPATASFITWMDTVRAQVGNGK